MSYADFAALFLSILIYHLLYVNTINWFRNPYSAERVIVDTHNLIG